MSCWWMLRIASLILANGLLVLVNALLIVRALLTPGGVSLMLANALLALASALLTSR